VPPGKCLPMFWRSVLPPSSGLKSKACNKQLTALAAYLLFSPEDGAVHSSETSGNM
jgi:hypothetical protein